MPTNQISKKITNLAMENKTIYQSPVCDVAMIRIEHGFAVSGTIETGKSGGALGAPQSSDDFDY